MSRLFYTEECTSTNDFILQHLDSSVAEPAAVYTFNQTKGRGQYGNLWESSQNLNVAYSIAVKDESIKTSLHLFNYYTAVLTQEFIATLTSSEVFIKWPNDLIIKNRKVAGMLFERKKVEDTAFLVLGIGINVMQTDFSQLPKAGSLLTQTGKEFDLHSFAEEMYTWFRSRLQSAPSDDEILQMYNNLLYRKDEVSVFSIGGMRQNGIIKQADADGHLHINLENDGMKTFYHKEIEMLY